MKQDGLAGACQGQAPYWPREAAFSLAALMWRVSPAALRGRNRARRNARARRLALHLAHVGLGGTLTTVSAGLSRHRACARRACAQTEDSRDVPAWDRSLDGLERALRLWCAGVSRQLAECAQ